LALSPAFCHPPYQPQQIVVGNRNETGREFDHVEAESLRFHEVFFDRLGTIAQHVLYPPAGRDIDGVAAGEIDDLGDFVPRHQREGPAGEFQPIDIEVHRVEDVPEITPPHHRVIGAANLGQTPRARLRRARIERNGRKGPLAHLASPIWANSAVSSRTRILSSCDTARAIALRWSGVARGAARSWNFRTTLSQDIGRLWKPS